MSCQMQMYKNNFLVAQDKQTNKLCCPTSPCLNISWNESVVYFGPVALLNAEPISLGDLLSQTQNLITLSLSGEAGLSSGHFSLLYIGSMPCACMLLNVPQG